MTYECPNCRARLQPQDLKNEWGNGIHCRKCSAEVRYSPPYPVIFLFGSAPILVAALAVRGVEEGFVASIKMVLAWFLGSICAAVFFSWIKPPKLKLANDGDEDPYPTPSIFK